MIHFSLQAKRWKIDFFQVDKPTSSYIELWDDDYEIINSLMIPTNRHGALLAWLAETQVMQNNPHKVHEALHDWINSSDKNSTRITLGGLTPPSC